MLGRGGRDRVSSGRRLGEGRALALAGSPARRPTLAKQLQAFVDRGGQVLFFPPRSWSGRVSGRAVDGLGRPIRRTSGRELAGRPGSAGPHPERRAAAGGSASGEEVLRTRRRAHAAGDAPRRGCRLLGRLTTSAGVSTSARPRRRRRFVAGHQRRRPLRAGPARAGAGARVLGNTRQLTAGDPAGRGSRRLEARGRR